MIKTVVTYVDDLDGTPATERVTFALDGRWYEIDLDEDNSDELHEVMGRYAASARRVPPQRSRSSA